MSTLLLMLLACQGSDALRLGDERTAERPALALFVTAPDEGSRFVGGDTTRVMGSVTPPDARVWVEGREVRVGQSGDFAVELPLRGPYRIIDIEAADGRGGVRETRTVLAGSDPLDSWPGAVSAVLTPGGLARAIGDVGELVDGLGWAALLQDSLPGTTVSHYPTTGTVTPTDEGLAFDITVQGLEITFDVLGAPVSLGWSRVELGIVADASVDDAGLLSLSFGEPSLFLGDLRIDAFDIEVPLLEDLIDGGLDGLVSLLEGVIDLLVGTTAIPIPLPLDLELDLLGTAVQTSLAAVEVTDEGVNIVLGVGIDGPPGDAGDIVIPAPDPWSPTTDLRLGLHEGLFQLILASDLLDLLDLGSLQLDGLLGNILALPLQGLPGGAVLPDAEGWCIGIDPGEARVARMPGGLEPLAALYLPELYVDIGYSSGITLCQPWLQATIATEALLVVEEGTRIGIDLVVADGTVHYYGSELPWDEDGVVDGLGNVLESILGLLGGALEFDLAELFTGLGTGTTTGLFPALAPDLLSATPMTDEDGRLLDGVHTLSLSLFE